MPTHDPRLLGGLDAGGWVLPQRHDAETSNSEASSAARCDVGRKSCQMGGPAGLAGD